MQKTADAHCYFGSLNFVALPLPAHCSAKRIILNFAFARAALSLELADPLVYDILRLYIHLLARSGLHFNLIRRASRGGKLLLNCHARLKTKTIYVFIYTALNNVDFTSNSTNNKKTLFYLSLIYLNILLTPRRLYCTKTFYC